MYTHNCVRWRAAGRMPAYLSCDIHTHTPALKSSTNFQLYYFVMRIYSTNWLGHGYGYEWHSLVLSQSPLWAEHCQR